ncbi:MAG: hypothetical protein ABEJ99_02815 [Candidatus Nanohaloarchaea archaeon]
MFLALFFKVVLYSITFAVLEQVSSMDSGLRALSLVTPVLIGPVLAWLSWKRYSTE